MLIVDAGCLYEIVAGTPRAESIRGRLATDEDQAAPHLIDVEVLGIIRREELRGGVDAVAAARAVDELRSWPGERFAHRGFIPRVWELRHNVRGWDAFYVALAEVFDATLLTLDGRLARTTGPRCRMELVAE